MANLNGMNEICVRIALFASRIASRPERKISAAINFHSHLFGVKQNGKWHIQATAAAVAAAAAAAAKYSYNKYNKRILFHLKRDFVSQFN